MRTETVVCDTRDFGIGRRVTAENWKALRAVGEKANQRLCDAQAADARFIPCLVTVNPDSDLPVRRVARWDDLPTESTELLERFVDKRLLVRYERKDGDVVEVALESLFEHWDELKEVSVIG